MTNQAFHVQGGYRKARAVVTALFSLASLAASAPAAVINSGQSIDFTSADFTSGSTAQKTLYVDTNTADSKDVWASVGMSIVTNGLAMTSSFQTNAYVTWKIDVPADLTIASFTWKWKTVYLSGTPAASGGDDQFAWQWSTDNTTWNNLQLYANNNASMQTLTNKSYSQSLADPTSVLYIRAALIEGTTNTSDSGYFAVNTGAATDASSYISVTTASVPEPAAVGFLCLGSLVMLARYRRD